MDDPEPTAENLERYYYREFACAYVRGMLPELNGESADDLLRKGRDAGLRLHRFKRTSGLPRVRRVVGILRSLAPETLLDIGSGRGVFLWPLLDAFPDLQVNAIDRLDHSVADLEAVARGGVSRLSSLRGDVTALPFPNCAFDGITMLEVLEHLEQPARGAREMLRVARRFVVASVPSKPDDNPEHLHLFNTDSLGRILNDAADEIGRKIRTRFEYVLNHMVAVVTLS